MTYLTTDRIALGRTALRVSPIGVGTNTWGAGRSADPALRATFDAVLESGLNFIDTAEIYGLGGSERTLGQYLPQAADKVVIATKFMPLPWRLRKADLAAALRHSLERLQIKRVDLYLVHFPFPPVAIETWVDALADAVQAGLAGAVGVSNYNANQVRQAHAVLAKRGIPLACNQVEYNLLNRAVEWNGVQAACRDLGVTLVAYRPVASGLLSGKYTNQDPPNGLRRFLYNGELLARVQPVTHLMQQIGTAHNGKTLSQVAINWLICKGALPIPGARSPRHALENAGAMGWRLSDDEITALDNVSDRAHTHTA